VAHHSTVLSQILRILPRHEFQTLAQSHHHGRKLRSISRWSQFVALTVAQLTGRCSLRDIVTNLKAQTHKLYHLGCRPVSRSSLARVNEQQPATLFEAVFGRLLSRCQAAAPHHGRRFKAKLYSLDASLIDLTLSLFPWARYQATKGAIKLHVGLDHSGHLPAFVHVSEGARQELQWARTLKLPAGSVVAFDRGFTDYRWWKSLTEKDIRFVTRLKRGTRFTIQERRNVTWKKNITSDQIIFLNSKRARPLGLVLRRIGYRDPDTGKHLIFVTNDLESAASTIAEVYRQRWQIELFFKWIKQNLKVKTFLGHSLNAVLSQLWVAMIAYLLLAHLKFHLRLRWSMSQILRLLQLTLLERRSLDGLLQETPQAPDPPATQRVLAFV
jgi:putative transposase